MKLSVKKKSALYSAIVDEMMRSRIFFEKQPDVSGQEVDHHMFYLTNRIWAKVCEALGLQP